MALEEIIEQILDKLDSHVEKLELEWPINLIPSQIFSITDDNFATTKEHNICFNSDLINNLHSLDNFNLEKPYLGNMLHELCHAHLAEKIDPTFAGTTSYKDNIRQDGFSNSQVFSSLDTHLSNVWVNDIFQNNWPKIFRAHNQNYINNITRINKLIGPERLVQEDIYLFPHKLSGYISDANRHDININFKNLTPFKPITSVHKFGDEQIINYSWEDVKNLAEYWTNLPKVDTDREVSLTNYEEAAQKSTEILRLPIKPKLIEEDGIKIWSVESL